MKGRVTLVAGAFTLAIASGCATPAPPQQAAVVTAAARAAAPATAAAPPGGPRVLIVTEDVRCGAEEDDSFIAKLLQADAESLPVAFKAAFGAAGVVEVLANPDVAALKAALTSSRAEQGLVLVYSGHGMEIRGDAGHPQSALCLKEVGGQPATPLPVSTLFDWMKDHRPAWMSLFISACHSSYVDVSRGEFPISAITLSPEDIAERAPSAGEARATTHVAAALVAALQTGAALDGSCDGWTSDRELVDAVAERLRADTSFVQRSLIMPRLRRQADQPLQLWRTDAPSTKRCVARIKAVREALSEDSFAPMERRIRGQRASAPFAGYFYLQGPREHAACAGTAGRQDGEPAVQRARLRQTCQALGTAGLQPLALRKADPSLLGAIAASFDFAEVYYVHVEDAWVHVDRMRDGRRIASRRGGLEPGDLPARNSVVARWPNGDLIARFGGRFPEASALADPDLKRVADDGDRTVAVCAEREGQCFFDASAPAAKNATDKAAAETTTDVAASAGSQEGTADAR